MEILSKFISCLNNKKCLYVKLLYLLAENDTMVAADHGLDLSDDFDVLR